jgi:hypothetical protein
MPGTFLHRSKRLARAVVADPSDHTTMDPRTGAVRSVQAADLILSEEELDKLWTPRSLERLARTYWRFLARVTLHAVTVRYSEEGRKVVAFGFVPLLTFQAPEYEMDDTRGIVRWRIERGVLVSKAGRGGNGYLEIDIERRPSDAQGQARAHVEVEVANFYPSIAAGIGRWFYVNTQSRIHVIVTHGFLRSLARLDLAESRVGRFADIDEVPDPGTPLPTERSGAVA